MALLKLVCLLLAVVMVASLPKVPVKSKYDGMLEKVVQHIKANTRAFDGLASFTSNLPLKGNWWHTTFTKFSVTSTSVVGYEAMVRADFAEGRHLGDNIIQFSGTLLVSNLTIPGLMNMQVKNKVYSAPFLAQKNSPTDEIMLTINYNEISKSVKVVELKQGYGAEFVLKSDCFTTDRKTYLGLAICDDMLDVAERSAFKSPSDIRRTWDLMLVKLIETTAF